MTVRVPRLHSLLAVLMAVSCVAKPTLAQAPPAADLPATVNPNKPVATEDAAAVKKAADEQRKQNLASVLLMLLAGVLIIGIVMIVGTMIWGAKLRRLARIQQPGPSRQDELWYLKKPPPAPPTSDGDVGGGGSDVSSNSPASEGESTP